MKVGIIGAGSVGTKLGARLLTAGNQVIFGARDPTSEKTLNAISSLPGSQAMSIPEAVNNSDIIILTVPGMRTQEEYDSLSTTLGPGITGKVIIDCTNPLSNFPNLEVHHDGTSGGEMCATAFPSCSVFKAFNTIGAEQMANPDGNLIPDFDGSKKPLTMLFAGDKEKEETVAQLISAVGFQPRYVGPIRYARNLESIAELWIHLAVPPAGFTKENWGRNFHFHAVGGN